MTLRDRDASVRRSETLDRRQVGLSLEKSKYCSEKQYAIIFVPAQIRMNLFKFFAKVFLVFIILLYIIAAKSFYSSH